MNPDQEMQAEAMDLAQDEILRLQEALAVEKEAHVDTAKALVACREALKDVFNHAGNTPQGDYVCWIGETTFLLVEKALRESDTGDDYVRKESVRPIVEALRDFKFLAINSHNIIDDTERFVELFDGACQDMEKALEQAKLLGL